MCTSSFSIFRRSHRISQLSRSYRSRNHLEFLEYFYSLGAISNMPWPSKPTSRCTGHGGRTAGTNLLFPTIRAEEPRSSLVRLLPTHCRTQRGRQGGARWNRNKCFKGLLRSQEEIDTGLQHRQHDLRADPASRCFWWGKQT